MWVQFLTIVMAQVTPSQLVTVTIYLLITLRLIQELYKIMGIQKSTSECMDT